MELILLGTGTSHGIPVIGCGCGVCRWEDVRDTRYRSSLYIEGKAGERILVDAGPEFRLQALREGILSLDALLLTHAHADHIHGLDDVRPLTREKELPVYGNGPAIRELRERFSYIFRETQRGGGKPHLHTLVAEGAFRLGELTIRPVPVKHGDLDILGWVFEEEGRKAAYVTDASAVGEEARRLLTGTEVLILGALRMRPHSTHMTFAQAADLAAELGARRTYLTHLCHEHAHREIEALCGSLRLRGRGSAAGERIEAEPALEPAWDGLRIRLP